MTPEDVAKSYLMQISQVLPKGRYTPLDEFIPPKPEYDLLVKVIKAQRAQAVDEALKNYCYNELFQALDKLQKAESKYRQTHDQFGTGNLDTGRAWDALRRAGDDARQVLGKLPATPKEAVK
jgi:hypothetical protein